jgi:hypothetical protein
VNALKSRLAKELRVMELDKAKIKSIVAWSLIIDSHLF